MSLRASLRAGIALAVFACTVTAIKAGESFSIVDAIQQAIHNYPSIGEATANRRATEAEMRQTQATGLPQVRLEAKIGPERYNQNITPAPLGNNQWLHGKEASIVVRQLLFDGFATVNQIWRQAARVDAASARVFERTDLFAQGGNLLVQQLDLRHGALAQLLFVFKLAGQGADAGLRLPIVARALRKQLFQPAFLVFRDRKGGLQIGKLVLHVLRV